ncbi:MAG: hypothetical protein LUI05_01685 [Oscillospiraceae bacterium]|nr:hypothetical protein [Oscillospiraceae bacterium]
MRTLYGCVLWVRIGADFSPSTAAVKPPFGSSSHHLPIGWSGGILADFD